MNMKKGLKSLWGLLIAIAVTAFSAQAQDVVSQACAPVNQDAPAPVVKAAKVEGTATYQAGIATQFTPVTDFKAAAAEKASSSKRAKQAPAKVASVKALEGEYVLTGKSMLTSGYNGVSVTVAALGTDSIAITNFWAKGYSSVLKAKVDVATGAIIVPYQVMGQHETYGDIVFAKTNLADGSPTAGEAVAGVVTADGMIKLTDAWGAYVKAKPTDTKWAFFSVVNNTELEKCNAVFTGKKHTGGEIESYGVVFKQTAENVATIKNLGDYGQTVKIELKRNKTATIPSSLMAYNSEYGDFYSYNLIFTETGAKIETADAVTTVATDLKCLSWSNWGVVTGTTKGSRYLVVAYDSCGITTGVDIQYPSLSVTEFQGEGSEASPYLIKTRDDLILLSDKVAEITEFDCTTPPLTAKYCRAFLGKYFRMENDIDMAGYKFTPIGDDWQHIFAGTFDGGNYTIKGLYVDKTTSYAALFGRTDTVAVIKNLNIESATIRTSASYASAIAAWSLGTIQNVSVKNSTISADGYAVGAVSGITYAISDAKVENCQINGKYGYTGGVAGEAHAPISNCYAKNVKIVSATVSSDTPGLPVGGVVGNLYYADMENCWFAGTIDGSSLLSQYQSIGGVAGFASAATVKNCFAVGNLSTYGPGAIVGGIVGFLRGNLENCFFNGRVDATSARSSGGAVGRLCAYRVATGEPLTECKMTNVYSAGSVVSETYQYQSQTDAQNNEIIGVILNGSKPVLNNVYFDKQVVSLTNSAYGVNTEQLVGAQGPAGFDAKAWTFTEGRYPALTSFKDLEASKLATVAVVMPNGATFDKFTKNATLNKDASVAVGFLKGNTISNNGYYANISGNSILLNEEGEFGNDTLFYASSTDKYVRYYRIVKVAPIPYEGGGVADNPFLIKTKADLILLSQLTTEKKQLFPETYFKLANDIDLEYDEAFLGICSNADDAHNYFAGTIDGDGHYIHKMKFYPVAWKTEGTATSWGTLNTSACKGYKGFVGRLSADGVVKNVNIASDCDLKYFATSSAVVAYNSGLVENCRNYSDVLGYSCWIGGIVGQNLKEGKIRNCYNAGNIVGGYGQVAGIAGATYSIIENCMNVGRIEIRQLATNFANQLQSAGGIAGTSSSGGKFVNCVNAGTVTAQIKRVGGIVGYWGPVLSATASYYKNDMINCVNYGTVFSPDASTNGALAGGEKQSESEEISGNYWDVQILDINPDANAAHEGMNGVETSVLTSGKALEGFDTSIWQFEAGKYPVLKAFADEEMVKEACATKLIVPAGVTVKNLSADATVENGTPVLSQGTKFTLAGNVVKGIPTTEEVVTDTLTITNGKYVKIIALSAMPANPLQGAGTAEDPYRITTPQEWNALASFMSKTANNLQGEYVAVMNDIDFTGVAEGITPLGNDGVTPFDGNFDGKGFAVKGYSYKTKEDGEGALFGTIGAEGVVSNLTSAGEISGGLGGPKGTTKLGHVGGFVGRLYGKLVNVTNTGKVKGIATYNAGVAGFVQQGAVLDGVKNYGEITSSAAYVAGVAAYVYEDAEFNKCVNYGNISSSVAAGYAAGIAATALPSKFVECVNEGQISSGSSAGIVANCSGKSGGLIYTFDRCQNNGEVTGNGILGGITAVQGATAGNNVCHYIQCVNNGDITATATQAVSSSAMAGIAAFYSPGSVFEYCINTGFVTNTKSVYTAGIAAYNKGYATADYPVVFKGCVNTGNIASSAQQIAGIVAYITNYTSVDSCLNYGTIEQGIWGAAGICYTMAGTTSSLTNCINYGDVSVTQYNAGGIVGNCASTTAVIENCVNVGNITSTTTAEKNNYGVGGIAGSSYATMKNCFNAGKVVGKLRVGGIVGSPSYYAKVARTQLVNCVNVGLITADEGCGGALVGTTKGEEEKYWGDNNSCTNSYYLNDLSAKGEGASYGDNNVIGTGVGVKELVALDLNEGQDTPAWVRADNYSYQLPLIAAGDPQVQAHAAAVVLAEGDTYTNVTKNKFNVGTAENLKWDVPEMIKVDGNDATVTTPIQGVTVTLYVKPYFSASKNVPAYVAKVPETEVQGVPWILTLNVEEVTGINDVSGKTVVGEAYYTVGGAKVAKPEANDGQIYIIVRKYSDGSVKALKLRN